MLNRLISLLIAGLLFFCPAALAESVEAVETPAPGQDASLEGALVILCTSGSLGRDEGALLERAARAKARFEEVGAVVVLIDAGDTLTGAPFCVLSRGKNPLRLMNAARYDALIPSAADMSYGVDRLNELSTQADFAFLSASTPSTIIERSGLRIGVLAADTALQSEEAMLSSLDALKAQNCDVLVALGRSVSGCALSRAEGLDFLIDSASSSSTQAPPMARWSAALPKA